MTHGYDVLFRPAIPPEAEGARWRGFAPGRSVLTSGSTYSPNGRNLSCDIVFDRDVAIIVALEIPIRPLGMFWRAGEQLQVLLSALNLQPAELHVSGNLPDTAFSTGVPDPSRKAIRVHTGGDHDSHLLVSYIPLQK